MNQGGDRLISIAVLAVGGQGGGVLSNWLIQLAEANGWRAQNTSVPGVAQRTGATIYYIEMFPERDEVLALSRQDARSVFLAQYSDWQEYKVQLAEREQLKIAEASEASMPAPAATSETPTVEMTPTVEEPKEPTEVAAKEPEQEAPAAAKEVIEEQPKQESMPTAKAATPAPRAAPPRDLLKIVRAAIDDADKGRLAEGESDRSQAERVALCLLYTSDAADE